MELIVFFIALLLFYVMLVKLRTKSIDNRSKLKLPPGPKPLPIIGNIHQLFGSPLIHHLLRDLAKCYGPLMHLKLGETSIIVLTSPEIAKEIYKTNDHLFASRPTNLAFKILSYDFQDIICSPYGNHWRQLRKICTIELLSPTRVQTFRSIREDEVFNLIESISSQKGSVFNLSRGIFSLGGSITSRAAFGKKSKHTEKYVELADEINHLVSGFCLADLYPSVKLLQALNPTRYKMERVHKQIDEMAEKILSDHKEKRAEAKEAIGGEKEDLVDVLINMQRRGDFEPELSDTIIKAVIIDIFVAGTETSLTAMEWAMAETVKNPEVMKRAQDEVRRFFDEKGNVEESRLHELKYLHAIFKETLRLHPPPLLAPRSCSENCEVGGYEIPKNATVIVNAYAIGRDPKYWPEAERFNPDRFLDSQVDYKGNDFEYIPFGAGRRICPGISFSQPIVELVLAQLLFHFDWELEGGLKHEELDMDENFGGTTRRKHHLRLIPTLYRRSILRN